MVKSKQKHDPIPPTLSFEVLMTLKKQRNIFLLLEHHYPQQTAEFEKSIYILHDAKKANHTPQVLEKIENFRKNCNQFNLFPISEKQEINCLLNSFEETLNEIAKNLQALEEELKVTVTITCALDGYTLNRTTYLIQSLDDFIQEAITNLRPSHAFFTFDSSNEIIIAKKLKEICTMIRSQIGSPETMPKGLLIDFMTNLCDALSYSNISNPKLLGCIKKEILYLQHSYPDLAQAGEELQKAIANYQLQKS